MKIDIQEKNVKYFGDIALLVDNEDFLKSIAQLRKRLKINIVSPTKFNDYLQELYEKNKLQEFDDEIRDLRIKFKRPDTFDIVISYAVVCHLIPNRVYKSTYYGIADIPLSKYNGKTSRIAIFVTPQSKNEDVLDNLKEIRRKIFKKRNDGYDVFFDLYNKKFSYEIKRDRYWFWEYKTLQQSQVKRKYRELLDRWNNNFPELYIDDVNIIQQAISRYRKFLNTDR